MFWFIIKEVTLLNWKNVLPEGSVGISEEKVSSSVVVSLYDVVSSVAVISSDVDFSVDSNDCNIMTVTVNFKTSKGSSS